MHKLSPFNTLIQISLFYEKLKIFYSQGHENRNSKSCKTGYVKSVQSALSDLLKSVQSALSDLLTTSATRGTFSRRSTKHGLISIGLELNTNARESFEHC